MNELVYDFDDEALFEDDDELFEDEDEALFEDDGEDYDERRRRRRRGRRIRPGKVSGGRGLYKARPNKNYVTQSQLKAGLSRVGKQIQTNGVAIKRTAAQVSSATKSIARVNASQDKRISGLKSDIKKQADASLLMALLRKPPTLEKEKITFAGEGGATQTIEVVTNVKDETNILLPLLLTGGLGGGDSSNTTLMALALSGAL